MKEQATTAKQESIRQKINSFPYWYHQIEIEPGISTPGTHASAEALQLLQLPQDCRGMRVLDIGARDGFFSFELERRGAKVLAIDYFGPTITGFAIASELLRSRVRYEVLNVYDLSPATHGKFDIVLFLGVLYHLRNPLLALDRIWNVCRDRLWLESQVIDNAFLNMSTGEMMALDKIAPLMKEMPIMQFYPKDELNKDGSNWWAPNLACLTAMLETCNFVVQRKVVNGGRAIVECKVGSNPVVEHLRFLERSTANGGHPTLGTLRQCWKRATSWCRGRL
jgi:tRNA (mo5U34)-methyltransferase